MTLSQLVKLVLKGFHINTLKTETFITAFWHVVLTFPCQLADARKTSKPKALVCKILLASMMVQGSTFLASPLEQRFVFNRS